MIERVLEAHGGLERWRAARSISVALDIAEITVETG